VRGYVILILRPEPAHGQRTRSLWRRRNSKVPLSTPRLDHRSVADDLRDVAVHTARSLKSRPLGLFGARRARTSAQSSAIAARSRPKVVSRNGRVNYTGDLDALAHPTTEHLGDRSPGYTSCARTAWRDAARDGCPVGRGLGQGADDRLVASSSLV